MSSECMQSRRSDAPPDNIHKYVNCFGKRRGEKERCCDRRN